MVQVIVIAGVLIAIYVAVMSVFGLVSGIFNLLIPVLVWMFIGWMAGKLLRGKGYGPIGDVLLGLTGGIIGSFVLGLLNINLGGLPIVGPLAVGVFGAVILVFAIRLVHDSEFAS